MKTLSVVMPLYNGEAFASAVVPPLREAFASGQIDEIIIVDDGSSDDGIRAYRDAGFTTLSSGGRRGPAACRNLGVESATGTVVLFLDSDVVMSADVPELVRRVFEEDSNCVAVFGSYDDDPAVLGLVSQYRNLLHHHVHHRGREEASTFWAGCGAVDRAAFNEVRGFDATRYPRPSIEDIELGLRLIQRGGRILLRPEIQVKHLKRWTLLSMVRTDVFQRAIPWSRLMMEPGYEVDDLNVSRTERSKALVALLFWFSLSASLLWTPLAWVAASLLLLALVVNAGFFRLVWKRRGLIGASCALLLHQLYYLYSVCAFLFCAVEARLNPVRKKGMAT